MIRKTLALTLLVAPIFPAETLSETDSQIAKRFPRSAAQKHCDGKWGTDYSMVEYCMNQQVGDFITYQKKLDLSMRKGSDLIVGALRNCEEKWPRDWSMTHYCADQQFEGYKAMFRWKDSVSDDRWRTIGETCFTKWALDFSMVYYCIKKQDSARRRLNK